MRKLSIKLRVTLWFTLFMVVIVAACLGFLFAMGAQEAARSAQNQVLDAVVEALDEIEYDDGRIEIDDDLEYFNDGVYISVYSTEGALMYGRLPSAYLMEEAFSDGRIRSVDDGSDTWYVYDILHSVGPDIRVWVRGVISYSRTSSTLVSMIRLAAAVFPALVLLAAAGGYLLVNRAFRPVRQIAEAADRINDGNDLSRRIGLKKGRDEIYTLAMTFDRMFDRLQVSFEREKQFTSDVSHELRTPTAVIISQCEYALEEARTLDEAKDALSTVLDQAERMSSMIGQLLTLSRADRGQNQLHLELINLSELTMMVAEQAQELAEKSAISVETQIEPDLLIHGDETMLMRMLLNLTENGIKYGRPGGHLRVRLSQTADSCVRGEIQDDGIGISPEHLPKIWDRFYQVNPARSSSDSGVGLGLPMVKYIAEAHGGSITAESREGEGTTFIFTLPR